jgi:hypothetical protein
VKIKTTDSQEYDAMQFGRQFHPKPPIPIGYEAERASEPVWTTWGKFLTLPGLELRPLGRPARSQSLCRLRYPCSLGENHLEDLSMDGIVVFIRIAVCGFSSSDARAGPAAACYEHGMERSGSVGGRSIIH